MYRRTRRVFGCSVLFLMLVAHATVSLGDVYSNYVSGLSPSIYYRFDEAPIVAGTTAMDNLGALGAPSDGTYATYNGSALATTGVDGGAIAGNAGFHTTGYSGGPATYSLASGATPFSMSFWMKPDSVTGTWNSMVTSGSNDVGLSVGQGAEGKVVVNWFNSNLGGNWDLINSSTTIVAGAWQSVGLTYDGTQLRLYVNGALDGTCSTGIPALSGQYCAFGGLFTDGTRKYSGGLDEFSYWIGGALSDATMGQLGVTAPVPEPSAVILVFTGVFGLLAYAWKKRK